MKANGTKQKSGLTLVEVMVAALAALVIVIGTMGYQYHCALDARKADVRVTGARLGLLLLDAWKTMLGDTVVYDPKTDLGTTLPVAFTEFTLISPPPGDPPGLATSFRYYRIEINGAKFFVKMSYQDQPQPPRTDPLRLLNVRVAWNRDDFKSTTLTSNYQSVSFSKYAYY
ncbi:MAG TPA: hypothetical protein VMX13_17895 [Sedimentisphaerales bacterium]|nr:hypothetical protein [Sedimentisphaerales bacterium]